jgi:hypothetical protein
MPPLIIPGRKWPADRSTTGTWCSADVHSLRSARHGRAIQRNSFIAYQPKCAGLARSSGDARPPGRPRLAAGSCRRPPVAHLRPGRRSHQQGSALGDRVAVATPWMCLGVGNPCGRMACGARPSWRHPTASEISEDGLASHAIPAAGPFSGAVAYAVGERLFG